MSQSSCDKTGENETNDDCRDHQIVEVVLDEIEPLAVHQPGAVHVKAVDHHHGGLEATGRGHHTSNGLHLLLIEDTLMRAAQECKEGCQVLGDLQELKEQVSWGPTCAWAGRGPSRPWRPSAGAWR